MLKPGSGVGGLGVGGLAAAGVADAAGVAPTLDGRDERLDRPRMEPALFGRGGRLLPALSGRGERKWAVRSYNFAIASTMGLQFSFLPERGVPPAFSFLDDLADCGRGDTDLELDRERFERLESERADVGRCLERPRDALAACTAAMFKRGGATGTRALLVGLFSSVKI